MEGPDVVQELDGVEISIVTREATKTQDAIMLQPDVAGQIGLIFSGLAIPQTHTHLGATARSCGNLGEHLHIVDISQTSAELDTL